MTRPVNRGWSAFLMVAGLAMLALRTWIGLDHPLPLGALGHPLILRANKLSGWLTAGLFQEQWRGSTTCANLVWELLPAALFATGLAGWCLTATPEARWPRFSPRPAAALAIASFVCITAGLSWFCFRGMPHVQDSIAQQFQAQLFARGQAYASAPPVADQLANEFVVQDRGRWYAQYPPMQPALLALGVLAGAPWLINPLAGALAILLLYRTAKIAYGAPTAGAALALCIVSPFLWFMSAERMNHTATLLFLSGALCSIAPALRRRPGRLPWWRYGAGALCLGLAISSRPLCGVAVAVPMLAAMLLTSRGPERENPDRERGAAGAFRTLSVPLAGIALGLCVGVLPLLTFNTATTGSPFRSGYEVLWGSSGWGFGNSQWGPPHTPLLGLVHTVTNWDAAAKYLFEWPIPSLLPLLGLAALRRRTPMDWLLSGTLLTLSAAYFPYFFQDLCLGPRFLYAGMPALILLSARGLRGCGLYLARHRGIMPRRGISVVARAAVGCSVVGLAVNLPLLLRWYGDGFWGTTDVLTRQVHSQQVHHALVVVQDYNFARRVRLHRLGVSDRAIHSAVADLDERWIDDQVTATAGLRPTVRAAELTRVLGDTAADPRRGHRRTRVQWIDYQGHSTNANLGFYANTPWPEGQDVIYAVDLGPDNRELFRTYPGRQVWRYAYDATAGDFRLQPVEGQITSR
jgi:hypothetical protein